MNWLGRSGCDVMWGLGGKRMKGRKNLVTIGWINKGLEI